MHLKSIVKCRQRAFEKEKAIRNLWESEISGAPIIKMGRLPVSKEVMPHDQ